ncbi:hypothetical protein P4V41_07635 [Fictibacillus nanhaiensis]|uniref:phage lytic cycle repressor MrpR family protein n=1 Tax=Fictibacillus nanhaiensis TaxID=742169 RepID=UPI002E2366EE|nr:hypothetical protein [Fictibacillus nanhaiensis]
MNSLYNEDIKRKFLETYENEQTRTTIEYILYKAQPMEEILGKDIYDFTRSELGVVIQNTDPLNLTVARSTGRHLTQYITWAMKYRTSSSNLNPLKSADAEWYEQFVSKKKLYMSFEELKELENKLVNAQDVAPMILLFEGVNGQGSSELLNLRKQDVDAKTNVLQLRETDKNGQLIKEREVTVSDYCMRILQQAMKETTYKNKNGNAIRGGEVELVNNEFVIRSVNRRVKDVNAPADKHAIFRRLTAISEMFDLPYLTPKSIERSGMIYMAKELYVTEGELEKDQYYKICEQFGMKKAKVGDWIGYNLSFMKEYVNMQNITELYKLDIAK